MHNNYAKPFLFINMDKTTLSNIKLRSDIYNTTSIIHCTLLLRNMRNYLPLTIILLVPAVSAVSVTGNVLRPLP